MMIHQATYRVARRASSSSSSYSIRSTISASVSSFPTKIKAKCSPPATTISSHRSLSSSSSSSSISSSSNNDETKNNHNHNNNNDTEYSSPRSSSTTLVRSSLSFGKPVPYTTGWAWQQALLRRRLDLHRTRKQKNQPDDQDHHHYENEDDRDHLLLLEHEPVYTLGRGADENHLVFLNRPSDDGRAEEEKKEENRLCLARKSRGPGSARLGLDSAQWRNIMTTTTTNHHSVDHVVRRVLRHHASSGVRPVWAPNQVPVYRIERGGEVTWHGPGQLVAYPLVYLRRAPFRPDLHWYLRRLEDVVLRVLRHHYGIDDATRDTHDTDNNQNHTGVWVRGRKIAAVGVSASGWITTHGFAINVEPDLSYFDTSLILPCGIEGRGVTSIRQILIERNATTGSTSTAYCPSVAEVAEATRESFETVFGLSTTTVPMDK